MKECPRCWGTGKIPNDHEIGLWARHVREAEQLSLLSFARILKITPGYLSYLERGKRRWSKKLYQKVLAQS